jgi:hypothetical protein
MVAALGLLFWRLGSCALGFNPAHDVTEQSDHHENEQRIRKHIQHRFLPRDLSSYPPPERWNDLPSCGWLMSTNG